MSDLPTIRITYCTQCQWLLRAGWMAQELLSTFAPILGEVTLARQLRPFTISCNEVMIWDCSDGGFPDAANSSSWSAIDLTAISVIPTVN